MIKEALLGILSSGSSLGNAACHLGGYLDDKATDLNKAKQSLAIMKSITGDCYTLRHAKDTLSELIVVLSE